jgi:hypothetical protein
MDLTNEKVDINNKIFTFVKIDKKNKESSLIYDFYHNVCKKCFDEHELEDYFNWENAFKKKNIYTSFIIIICDDKAIGGIVTEIYLRSMCCLISYIAISEEYRKYGLSRLLIEKSIQNTLEYNNSIKDIFIEVLVPESEIDFQRQKIWKKLNFLPFDFYFQHPGKLKWRNYQLAKYNLLNEQKIKIEKKKLISYFIEFFKDITCEIIVRTDSSDNIASLTNCMSPSSNGDLFDSENYNCENFIQELNKIKEIIEQNKKYNEDEKFIFSQNLW